jgi:hypothetical protein
MDEVSNGDWMLQNGWFAEGPDYRGSLDIYIDPGPLIHTSYIAYI